MSNEYKYKGYSGSCEVSIDDGCLHGRILFIDDLITYEGNSVPELEVSFKTSVDGYINYCEQTGKPANKPYSGTFNVRIGPDLHKQAAQKATYLGIRLNQLVINALQVEVAVTTSVNNLYGSPTRNAMFLIANNGVVTNAQSSSNVNPQVNPQSYNEMIAPHLQYMQ